MTKARGIKPLSSQRQVTSNQTSLGRQNIFCSQCASQVPPARMPLVLWCLLFVSASPLPGGTTQPSTPPPCSTHGAFQLPGFQAAGDLMIGGIFPLHYRVELPITNYTSAPPKAQCHGFDPRAFRWAQSLRLAVEQINQNQEFLPNHTLGYKIFDSCATPITALRAALSSLNGPGEENSPLCTGTGRLLALVGESGSSQSIVLSRTLQPFRIPMISYFSTCSCLSNRKEFPTFFRVVPNDDYQVKALARLLQQFGWRWIGVVLEDHDYGRFALQGLRREIQGTDVCLAYSEMIPKDYRRERVLQILEVMQTSSARVVVVFSGEGELYPFLREFEKQKIPGLQWVASEAWVSAKVLAEAFPFLDGTVGFAVREGKVPGLGEFVRKVNPETYPSNPLVRELWGELYGCDPFPSLPPSTTPLPLCTGKEVLLEEQSAYMDFSGPRVSYNVYKAVYAIAHSLHSLLSCQPDAGPFLNQSCALSSNIDPWQLQHYLQEVSFNASGEEVNFDLKGDSIPSYDLMNWQRNPDGNPRFVKVGLFDGTKDSGKELVIQEEAIVWAGHQSQAVVSVCSSSCAPGSRKAVRHGEPLCCFDCVPCDSGKISNQTDSIECTVCPEDFWSNDDGTRCIPKTVEFLSHDAMGLSLTVIAVAGACLTIAVLGVFLHNRNTPIVRINNSELSYFILISLTLCFLCALVFVGEPTTWSCMLRHTAFSITFSLCISCILGKTLVVLAAFTSTRPGNNIMRWLGPRQQRVIIFSCTLVQVIICTAWLTDAPPFPSRNSQHQSSKIILECSVGSSLAFWCVLGYISLLACLCFVLAFLARKLPGNFNEAKFITFSMLIFCAVWVSFIPAYVSSPGKYADAVETFAILASSYGLLFCLFAPKCFIILLRPEQNTKQHLMGKK
ncbi:extracellular calcium-sensing receptor-like isoform X2 [Osmerus eperlanus]|uniref:extracellular calcium-sensing receptor-like isoform X2 n=1 Tax=Osmerus eperlanus TaxID=29151 RepID=UPI002E14C962